MSEALHILLFSAARGARFQIYSTSIGWYTVARNPDGCGETKWRIHPDDQLLRYGPISRQLFEAAKDMDAPVLGVVHREFVLQHADMFTFSRATVKNRRMFLLMLAEELAWEGL